MFGGGEAVGGGEAGIQVGEISKRARFSDSRSMLPKYLWPPRTHITCFMFVVATLCVSCFCCFANNPVVVFLFAVSCTCLFAICSVYCSIMPSLASAPGYDVGREGPSVHRRGTKRGSGPAGTNRGGQRQRRRRGCRPRLLL